MIELDRVTMNAARPAASTILTRASLAIPSDRSIALFGPSPEDNKALIHLLAGITMPKAGCVVRKAKVSFPVGYMGGFVMTLPVRINVAHLARLYGANDKAIISFVESIAHLGEMLDEPYGLLPGPTRRMIAHIVAYSIPFDVYLLTETIVRGKTMQANVTVDLFEARARTAGMIVPMRNPKLARQYCEMGMILDRGQLVLYDSVEDAILASQG